MVLLELAILHDFNPETFVIDWTINIGQIIVSGVAVIGPLSVALVLLWKTSKWMEGVNQRLDRAEKQLEKLGDVLVQLAAASARTASQDSRMGAQDHRMDRIQAQVARLEERAFSIDYKRNRDD